MPPPLLCKARAKGETTLASCRVPPQFLTESAEEMQEDQPWIVCLSRELSQQLSSSSSSKEDKVCSLPAPSWQHSPGHPAPGLGLKERVPVRAVSTAPPALAPKVLPSATTARARALLLQEFLYRALGTVLASCRRLTHVQGQLLKYLKETDATRPCDKQVKVPLPLLPPLCPVSPCPCSGPFPFPGSCRFPRAMSCLAVVRVPELTPISPSLQGIASVVSYAAERHFYVALDAMSMVRKALIKFGRRQRVMAAGFECSAFSCPLFTSRTVVAESWHPRCTCPSRQSYLRRLPPAES